MDNLKDNKLYCDDQSQRGKTIYSGEYRGYKWEIKTMCTYPTAYVYLNDSEYKYINNNSDYVFVWDKWGFINVHGGITFYKNDKIGWDYAHCNDYYHTEDRSFSTPDDYIWTYDDIMSEIKDVIHQLEERVKNYNDNSECIQEFKNNIKQAIHYSSKNLPSNVNISKILQEIANDYK
jgi:hypothetical protein